MRGDGRTRSGANFLSIDVVVNSCSAVQRAKMLYEWSAGARPAVYL
jgi:hypothetical protein